eukprot:6196109-Pleurochrysis_carterae.AAC.3
MIASIHAVPRLLYMRPFKPYFLSGRVEGPDVAKLVRRDETFTRCCAQIDEARRARSRARTQPCAHAAVRARSREQWRMCCGWGRGRRCGLMRVRARACARVCACLDALSSPLCPFSFLHFTPNILSCPHRASF